MAKYSYEFKKQVIEAYLSGEGGYKYLAKRYGVPAWSNIKKWVRNYETHGDKGLMRSRKQDKYSFEKKLSVVELYLSSEISYQDLALQEGITNSGMIANWYGAKTGILVGFAYGLLQFIQGPYVLSLFQVCCDYVFAFAALGVAGFFGKKKNGLLIGYIVAVLARGFFHTLGGYLYWMDYMPENFPQSLKALYPIIYNYSYLLAEGVLTVILISLPPVKKALQTVARTAHGAN